MTLNPHYLQHRVRELLFWFPNIELVKKEDFIYEFACNRRMHELRRLSIHMQQLKSQTSFVCSPIRTVRKCREWESDMKQKIDSNFQVFLHEGSTIYDEYHFYAKHTSRIISFQVVYTQS